jgi:2,4-dienoyl-CoA reductase-like NADH-dependent reductase (Old Yellow Enzyme family)/thioredoxin reductase
MSLENLLSPIKVGNIEVPNRCVLAPMDVGKPLYAADITWPKKIIRYYEERAAGGTGLIITQFLRAFRNNSILAYHDVASICEDEQIVSHAELVDRIHKYETKIFLQIALRGGKNITGRGEAPSSIYSPEYIFKPRELTTDEMGILVNSFIDAAGRGMKAGYDGVEIHGGHCYLIGETMSPALNKRTDKYGGSFEGRMKFITDIIKGIRVKYPKFNIGVKFSAYEELEGGIDIELGKKVGKYISDLGVDYLHVSTESTPFILFSKYPPLPTIYQPRNTLVPLAIGIKEVCPDQVIMATGSIILPEEADTFIKEGKCDMVALGRTLFADAFWVKKAQENKPINTCIRCDNCFYEILKAKTVTCSVNPYLLHESEQDLSIPGRIKNVMIVGAGPAGIRCAITAAKRGHKVTLYEKMPYIGGMVYPGSRPKFKEDFGRIIDYFEKELKSSNVNLVLNTEVTPELIEKVNPDAVVIAIGLKCVLPDIPGIDSSKVISATEVLRDISKFKKGKAVVTGSGDVSCETACYLADNGFDVTIAGRRSELLANYEDGNIKVALLNLVNERGIKVYTSIQYTRVADEGLEVILPTGKEFCIQADLIVVAAHEAQDKDYIKELTLKVEEFYVIGDCRSVGRIKNAISEGERVGRWI